MLATLRDEHGNTTVHGLEARQTWRGAAYPPEQFRKDANVLDGVDLLGSSVGDMVWARPTATVLGIDCPPVVGSSAAIQPEARARINLRVPPGMSAKHAQDALIEHLRSVAPWHVKLEFDREADGEPFVGAMSGPAYETMTSAMRDAYGVEPVVQGQGGSIPLVQRLCRDVPQGRDHAVGRGGTALPDPRPQRECRPDGDRQHGLGRSPVPATVCGGGEVVTATPTTRTGGVLAATCLSTLVVNANTSAVSILLPAISEDTGMSVTTLQWAVTGYSLVGAAVIITAGSLGDVFGRRRIFQLGLLLFVASCVLIALSTTGGMVIAGRMIQGAAGSTILACGLSLLSVANKGEAQLRAVSLWGAAAAVGAAAGPLVGGLLVGLTGWQGLFWIDAVVAVVCIAITARTVTESRDPNRPRSIDYAGTVLVALTLAPLILALSQGSTWGWTSVATLGCLVGSVVAGVAFVAVERRVRVPLLDLALLRNRVLVGSTMAILIGAGTINALMYLLSLYFQDPVALGFSPLQAGLATLPATVGLVIVAPLVPRLAKRFGGRQVVAAGFAITAVGFVVIGISQSDWRYGAFVLPLIAVAVGMGLSNGPASSAATASVSSNQVGEASGVSNMARYVGAAVATALAASIYSSVTVSKTAAGGSPAEALSAGLGTASWVMAVFSAAGVLMAVLMGRHRPPQGTFADAAASAAAVAHTMLTSATSRDEPTAAGPAPRDGGTHRE